VQVIVAQLIDKLTADAPAAALLLPKVNDPDSQSMRGCLVATQHFDGQNGARIEALA
jgi:hypothetical protein